MFVQLSIHKPRPGQEGHLIDSMHRFQRAIQDQPGCRQVHTLKDGETGTLVGLAIWDSRDACLAARPAMMAAVQDDDFEAWEEEVVSHRLEPV